MSDAPKKSWASLLKKEETPSKSDSDNVQKVETISKPTNSTSSSEAVKENISNNLTAENTATNTTTQQTIKALDSESEKPTKLSEATTAPNRNSISEGMTSDGNTTNPESSSTNIKKKNSVKKPLPWGPSAKKSSSENPVTEKAKVSTTSNNESDSQEIKKKNSVNTSESLSQKQIIASKMMTPSAAVSRNNTSEPIAVEATADDGWATVTSKKGAKKSQTETNANQGSSKKPEPKNLAPSLLQNGDSSSEEESESSSEEDSDEDDNVAASNGSVLKYSNSEMRNVLNAQRKSNSDGVPTEIPHFLRTEDAGAGVSGMVKSVSSKSLTNVGEKVGNKGYKYRRYAISFLKQFMTKANCLSLPAGKQIPEYLRAPKQMDRTNSYAGGGNNESFDRTKSAGADDWGGVRDAKANFPDRQKKGKGKKSNKGEAGTTILIFKCLTSQLY